MKRQKTTESKEQQAAPQGYYAHIWGEGGPTLFLSSREREEAKYQRSNPRWYHQVGGWVCRTVRSFGGWLRRYATVVIMVATAVNVGVAYYQWDVAQKGVIIAEKTADTAQKQAQIALDMLHAQRPYISLGKPDGTIAQYRPPVEGMEKGTIELYLQNTGPAPATRLLVNASSSLLTAEVVTGRHLYRAWRIEGEKRVGWIAMGGETVGTNAIRIKALESTSIPSPDQWQLIKSREINFTIRGTFEYCDWWGGYTCEMFLLTYRASAGGIFTIDENSPCPPSMSAEPDLREEERGMSYTLERAPRCQQPEERNSNTGFFP